MLVIIYLLKMYYFESTVVTFGNFTDLNAFSGKSGGIQATLFHLNSDVK